MTHHSPAEASPLDEGRGQANRSHQAWLQSTFERLERPLLAYAMRLLSGDLDAARDCVQDTFLKLCCESRSHVEGHVDSWLYKTCRNRAMDHHRREARMIVNSDSVALDSAASATPEPGSQVSQFEQQQRLQGQIARLPEREQELLALRITQGLSYKQIAEITDLSVSNVGFLLHQAVTKLRTAMNAPDASILPRTSA